jgi:zeaxanthin glucosyltransferase
MRILFHVLPEPGHLNPTFPLARALANRGHEIIYTSAIDHQAAIESRGFRCVTIHRDAMWRGRLAEIDKMYVETARNAAWSQIRDRIDEDYFSGRIEELVHAIAPAVIAADIITLSPMQYVAHRLGIPCLQLSTSLSQRHDELPPLSSELLPSGRPLELAAAQWAATSIRFVAGDRVQLATIISSQAEQYCARFGYPFDQLSFASSFTNAFTAYPELVLAASAIDFPRTRGPAPIYLASPVELDRKEQVPDALAAFVDPTQPLIYASLGSQSGRYPHAMRLFRAFVDALRARPRGHAIVACGNRFFGDPAFADLPDNVLVVRGAPQLWVLRRAAAFVTHAGLGSIREAVALAVPMIAVPQQFDQFGNAARVVHHGLGVRLAGDAVSAAALDAALARVLDDGDALRARARAVDAACRDEEARTTAIEVFEGAAERSSPVRVEGAAPPSVAAREPGWLFANFAAFVMLAPGRMLRDPAEHAAIEIGGAGFTIARDLATALSRGTGPLLVHAEVAERLVVEGALVAGATLTCRWRLDVAEPLYEHARACAARVVQLVDDADLPTAQMVEQLIARHVELRRSGAPFGVLTASYRDVFEFATPLWHQPTRIVAAAVSPRALDAARWAQRLATHSLARAAVGSAAGSPAGAAIYERAYRDAWRELGDDLARRIAAFAAAARVEVAA